MCTEETTVTTETIGDRINGIIEREGHTIATFAKKIGVPWDDNQEYRIRKKRSWLRYHAENH